MGSLVIKSWRAETKPDERGTLVEIIGRRSGLIGLLLSLIGIDPLTKLLVSAERLEFSWASLSGTEYRVIPLVNICSTYYGYSKPWIQAIGLWAFVVAIGWLVRDHLLWDASDAEVLLGMGWVTLIGAVVAIIYYALNRRMTLGFLESSGHVNAISFKPSLIENVQIDAVQARNVSVIVQRCIEAKLRSR